MTFRIPLPETIPGRSRNAAKISETIPVQESHIRLALTAPEVEVGVHRAVLAVRLLREHPQLQYLGITASQRGVLVAAETQYSLQKQFDPRSTTCIRVDRGKIRMQVQGIDPYRGYYEGRTHT